MLTTIDHGDSNLFAHDSEGAAEAKSASIAIVGPRSLFVVGDQLLKGAALNAVQIAERLLYH